MTFELVTPFLKGFYLTISGHLPRRNAEGWKIAERSWDAYVHEQVAEGRMTEEEATEALNPPDYEDIPTPKEAVLVGRLEWDPKALQPILSAKHPPEVMIRSLEVYSIIYGFRDASERDLEARTRQQQEQNTGSAYGNQMPRITRPIGGSSRILLKPWRKRPCVVIYEGL
jgi:hypothetical protein